MSIKENITAIQKRIYEAQKRSKYAHEHVSLIVVTKNHSVESIKEVLAYDPNICLGENRVQEWEKKAEDFGEQSLTWHLIGHLQRNKVRKVVGHVALIQSLDSLRLAQEINKRAKSKDIVQDCLLQINVAKEEQKYGIEIEEVSDFLDDLQPLSNIRIKGLMFIAPNLEDKEALRPYFKKMRELFLSIPAKKYDNIDMQYLSMGMSDDYEIAIEEGSNMVRIGSAVFALDKED